MFDYLKKIIEQVIEINRSVDEYKELVPSSAFPAFAQINKAIKLLKQNRLEEAEKILLDAEEAYPPNEKVFRTLATLYEAERNYTKAIEYFKKAMVLNPIEKLLFVRLGYAQLALKQNEEALETFGRAMKIFDKDSEVIAGYGMALYRLKRFEKSREELTKAFALNAHNLNAMFLIATIDSELGDYESAEARFSLLVKIAPITSHLYEYAKLKFLKEDYDSAETLAKQAYESNKDFLPTYFLLAEICCAKFENEEALKWLKKAEENDFASAALYEAIGNIYLFMENFEGGLEAFNKANSYEQCLSVLVKLLICEMMLDKLDDAERLVKLYVSTIETAQTEDWKAWIYLMQGVFEYKMGSKIQAEDYLKKALQVTLKLPIAYYLLAKIYDGSSDNYKAEKYYGLTLEQNPRNLQAYKDFVEHYLKCEKFDEARFKIKTALKYFPENLFFENRLFYAGFRLLDENYSEYNVKELLKLAEKLEKKSTFLYADEKEALLAKLNK